MHSLIPILPEFVELSVAILVQFLVYYMIYGEWQVGTRWQHWNKTES